MRIEQLLNNEYKFNDKTNLPYLDIELILADAIDKDRIFIHAHPEYELTKNQLKTFENNLKRRQDHEPIAYITGEKEFYGYTFYVNKNVLIPRPATESLVDNALDILSQKSIHRKDVNILEVGIGSGCISISLALEITKTIMRSNVSITGIDVSKKALNVANKNLNKYQRSITKNRDININFIQCDIFSNDQIQSKLNDNIFDIVISNPPYIKTSEIANLTEDIKEYEPHLALDGGPDGQKFYKAIKNNLKQNTNEDTVYIFEGRKDKFIKVE